MALRPTGLFQPEGPKGLNTPPFKSAPPAIFFRPHSKIWRPPGNSWVPFGTARRPIWLGPEKIPARPPVFNRGAFPPLFGPNPPESCPGKCFAPNPLNCPPPERKAAPTPRKPIPGKKSPGPRQTPGRFNPPSSLFPEPQAAAPRHN